MIGLDIVKTITKTPSYDINSEFSIGQQNWDNPEHLAIGQISMEKVFPTLAIESGKTIDLAYANHQLDIQDLIFKDVLNPKRNIDGDTLLNRRLFNDALLVMHKGKVIHESYRNGMQKDDRHVIHSCTKSLCSMIAAMAIDEGLLNPQAPVQEYIPEFESMPAWDGVSIQHILDMQAGIKYSEDYTNKDADYWSYARAAGYYPPLAGEIAIGVRAWVTQNLNQRDCEPGTCFVYNSTLSNVLGMVLENIYKQSLAKLFEDKLYKKVGAQDDAYFNTDPQGFPITEGQFNATLQDFSKISSLMIRQGKNLSGDQVLPASFINKTVKPDPKAQSAYHQDNKDRVFKNGQYKNKFWVLEPEQNRFTMLGIHGQTAWFDLDRDLMIVTLGSYPKQDGDLMMSTFKQLWSVIGDYCDQE